MDSLTHIVTGACMGELVAGRQLGKKAMLIGAIAQSIPDLDFVASFWLPVCRDLLAHRGFTHSLLFALLAALLLAWVSMWLYKGRNMTAGRWLALWGSQLLAHLFIDCFNAYGTGLFEPFSHYRVSFNAVYVADPLFTLWPLVAAIVLLVRRMSWPGRSRTARVALGLCGAFLVYATTAKLLITRQVQEIFARQHIAHRRYFTTPTPLNSLLWYVVAEDDSGYHTGYRSLLDGADTIAFHYAPQQKALLAAAARPGDVAHLLRFSQGYYTLGMRHDSVVFNEVRFGEINGWESSHPQFMCYYFLQYPDANDMIIQRGRVASWNRERILRFLRRISGHAS